MITFDYLRVNRILAEKINKELSSFSYFGISFSTTLAAEDVYAVERTKLDAISYR